MVGPSIPTTSSTGNISASLSCGFPGDYADLDGLARLKAKYNFLLALDEAHATLVCGDRCL